MSASNQFPKRFGRKDASFLRPWRAATSRRSQARRTRPFLDLLEERTMLSTTITVNTLVDQVDQAGSPTVSLRDAIAQANVDYGDTIVFAPGLASRNAGFGAGVIGLTSVGDGTAGPSAL